MLASFCCQYSILSTLILILWANITRNSLGNTEMKEVRITSMSSAKVRGRRFYLQALECESRVNFNSFRNLGLYILTNIFMSFMCNEKTMIVGTLTDTKTRFVLAVYINKATFFISQRENWKQKFVSLDEKYQIFVDSVLGRRFLGVRQRS